MRSSPYGISLSVVALCVVLSACATKSGSDGPTLTGEARLRVAQAAEESGDYSLADSMYAEAATEDPDDASAQLHYADVLLRQGKVNEARDLLLHHMGSVSDPRQLQAGLAAIYVLSGDAARAVVEYDKLLASHPDDIRLIVDKAVALDVLGRHGDAQALYRRALYATPTDPVVISDFALSLVMSGKFQEATALVAPLRDADNVLPRVRNNVEIVLASSDRAAVASDDGGNAALQQLAQALSRGTDKPTAKIP